MAIPRPIPLYPTYKDLKAVKIEEFPDLASLLADADEWKSKAWRWGHEFLCWQFNNIDRNIAR